MYFVYSYKGYTIVLNTASGRCDITFPDDPIENGPAGYTYSLEAAYKFIDEMEVQ